METSLCSTEIGSCKFLVNINSYADLWLSHTYPKNEKSKVNERHFILDSYGWRCKIVQNTSQIWLKVGLTWGINAPTQLVKVPPNSFNPWGMVASWFSCFSCLQKWGYLLAWKRIPYIDANGTYHNQSLPFWCYRKLLVHHWIWGNSMFKQTHVSSIERYESTQSYTAREVTASYSERLNGCTLKMWDYETQ